MRAFIMAAGRGTRLAPLTDVVPKPLIPIANEPAIVGLLRTCAQHGIRDVVINVSYLGDQLINAIGDGSSLGIRVAWSREAEPMGTAGGMKNAEALLREGDEPVLVLSGDGLHDVDLSGVAAAHRAAGVTATIVLSLVDDPQEYGVAVRDERGYITSFQEKPSRDEALSHEANTGIYLFAPEIFDRL
ncbi:MAG: nucleotidyltransferase family protein, partial [Thermoleophilia bacterium]|nr:nucleotidyltransferase family protein [Thermoleophilia bacterium]